MDEEDMEADGVYNAVERHMEARRAKKKDANLQKAL